MSLANKQTQIFRLWAVALLCLAGTSLVRAQNVFIRFTGPSQGSITGQGSSKDAQFSGAAGWRLVNSVIHGSQNSNSVGSASGGAGAGRAEMSEITVETPMDSLTPRLFQVCTRGDHFDVVEIVTRSTDFATGAARPYSSFKMKLAYIVEITWALGSEGVPLEVMRLAYGASQMTYHRINTAGSVVSSTTARWDFVSNTGATTPFPDAPPSLSYSTNQKVGLGASAVVQPVSGPTTVDPLLPITLVNLGGFTGQAQVNPITGAITLNNAAPLGGPFNMLVRVTDIFGIGATATVPVTVVTAPKFLRIESIGTNVVLQLSGAASRSYQVQSANTVTGAWANVGSPLVIAPSGENARFTNSRSFNARFYRAVETP